MKSLESLGKLPVDQQNELIKKFAEAELNYLVPKDEIGEKILSVSRQIINTITDAGLPIDCMDTIANNVKYAVNMINITPLTLDDSEWCLVKEKEGVKIYSNYRSLDVRKIGDLVFPHNYEYYCSELWVYGKDKPLRMPMRARDINFEVKDRNLTGRVVIDWYLNKTKGGDIFAICGDVDNIQIDAIILKVKDGGKRIIHVESYDTGDDSVLIPFYIQIDELAGMDIDRFSEMSSDEVYELIISHEQRIEPERYSRKENNTI